MRTHEVSHRPKARMVSDVRRLPSGLAFSAAPRQREVVVGSDMRIRPVVRQVSAVEESRIGRYNRGAGADYYQEVIETQPLAEVVRVGVQARDLFESSRPGVSLRQMTLAQARQKAGGILTSEMPVSQPTRTAARLAAQDQTPAYKAAEVQAAEAIDKAHGSPPTQPSKLRKYGPWVLLGLVVAGIMSR